MQKFEIYSLIGVFLTIAGLIGANFYFISQLEVEAPVLEECEECPIPPGFDVESLWNILTFRSNLSLTLNNPNATYDAEIIDINKVGIKFTEFNSSMYFSLIGYLTVLGNWFMNISGESDLGDYSDVELDIGNIQNSKYEGNSIEIWADSYSNNNLTLGGFDLTKYIISEIDFINNTESTSSWLATNHGELYNNGLKIRYNSSFDLSDVLFGDLFDQIDEHVVLYSELSENATIGAYILTDLIPAINIAISPLLVYFGAGTSNSFDILNIESTNIGGLIIPKIAYVMNNERIDIDGFLNVD